MRLKETADLALAEAFGFDLEEQERLNRIDAEIFAAKKEQEQEQKEGKAHEHG